MRNIYISTTTNTSVSFTDADTRLVLIKDTLLSSSSEGIVATGDALDRMIVVDGEISAGATGIVFGAGTVADLNGSVVISASGLIKAGRAGISAVADDMEIINRGTVEARLTGVSVSGTGTRLTNEGTITSLAGSALDLSGASAMAVNNGTLSAQSDVVRLGGDRALMTNNGDIGSATGDGIVARGKDAILSNNGSIGVKGDGIFSTGAAQIITNNGKIGSGGSAIIAKGKDVIVTNSGTLNAGGSGIALYGDGGVVTNRKLIEVGGYALRISADDATVNNIGTLKGAIGIDVDGVDVHAANSGSITSWKGSAVDFTDAARGTFNNTGVIAAASGLAFKGGGGQQSLTNRGTIKGDVELGGGNDYFDGTGGRVLGHIAGGTGNDAYVISNAKMLLLEAKGEGIDRVQSSVTYTLGVNFENLTLSGTGAINATGNAVANQLHGNSSRNLIDGKEGKDVIWGHEGADILTGGAGADQFVFATKDGKDVITDFAATGLTHDTLDLTGLASITDYKDLVQHHMKQVGSDVLIDGLNGDSILLKGLKLASLHASDFFF